MPDFLLELGTEEIPARMIDAASAELARRVGDLLTRERLANGSAPESFSTPRRLSLLVNGMAARQPGVTDQLTGPPVRAAFKDGQPTPAAHAFAKKSNVDVSSLQRITTPNGEYLAANVNTPGRVPSDVLRNSLPRVIAALYWPKNMYCRAAKPERFVRPVRWILALLDGDVVPLEFGGVRAGKTSRGHRILSSGAITIKKPGEYSDSLRKASVVVSSDQRRTLIQGALENALRSSANDQRPKTKDRSANDQQPTTNNHLRFREDA